MSKFEDDYDAKMALRYLAWKSSPHPDLWAIEYAWAKKKGYCK